MKVVSENKRARFDYEILEIIEAGIELVGQEVKSAKEGKMSLVGSYALIRGGEAWLLNALIPPYQPGNAPDSYDPSRTRRLLLKKSEISRLIGKTEQKAITLVPLRAYIKHGFIKIELALGKSRKKQDKREKLKKKAIERDVERRLKG